MKLLLKKCPMCASVIVHVFTSGDPTQNELSGVAAARQGADQWGTLRSESSHAACREVGKALLSKKMKVMLWHEAEL